MNTSVRDQLHAAAMSVQELGDIDRAIASGVQHRNRTRVLLASVTMACVALLAAVFASTLPGGSQPEPLGPPAPAPSSFIERFRDGKPGEYSAPGGLSCWSADQVLCLLNNRYASGNVNIYFKFWLPYRAGGPADPGPDGSPSARGTPVVVAGYEGVYRRVDKGRERWLVDIAGTSVAIHLNVEPGAKPDEVAEAHAIIDSLRVAPSEPVIEFHLLFTITSDNWEDVG